MEVLFLVHRAGFLLLQLLPIARTSELTGFADFLLLNPLLQLLPIYVFGNDPSQIKTGHLAAEESRNNNHCEKQKEDPGQQQQQQQQQQQKVVDNKTNTQQ